METQRERSSSGHAPIAGVGESDGEGDSRLKEGCFRSSGVSAMMMVGWVAVPESVLVLDPGNGCACLRLRGSIILIGCVYSKERGGLCPAAASSFNKASCQHGFYGTVEDGFWWKWLVSRWTFGIGSNAGAAETARLAID